jgi:hypothetical protein
MKKTNQLPRMTRDQARLVAANIRAIYAQPHAQPDDGTIVHDRIVAANAALFTEGTFSQPLTDFAVGFRDSNDIEASLQFFAPRVSVSSRFEYAVASNIEEFFSETDDDLRPVRGDFKEVEYTEAKVLGKTENRGLSITVDLDQVKENPNWRNDKTAKLLRRLRRNALRRAVALLSAAAVNTGKTWDTTAGKDPDQDVLSELVLAATASGVRPNRVGFGDTTWSKRGLAHRAQNTAGGFASASMTPEALAALLAVDKVHIARERFQSTASAKAEVLGALVLLFMALDNADTEDSSNIKRFVSPCEGGVDVRVYEQQITSKLIRLTVEHYEKTAITSTLGIRKLTIS